MYTCKLVLTLLSTKMDNILEGVDEIGSVIGKQVVFVSTIRELLLPKIVLPNRDQGHTILVQLKDSVPQGFFPRGLF